MKNEGVKEGIKMTNENEKTIRVYFAETGRFANVRWNEETSRYVRQLVRDEGVYMASIRADYEALRPHEVSP